MGGSSPPDAPEVLDFLRGRVLTPPSPAPYNLAHPLSRDPSEGQTKIIKQLLGDMVSNVWILSKYLNKKKINKWFEIIKYFNNSSNYFDDISYYLNNFSYSSNHRDVAIYRKNATSNP